MNLTELRTSFLDGGIRSTNFFNGRLLSGEDMTAEHVATIERFCRLGKAVGSGVANGLEVSVKHPDPGESRDEKSDPVLRVSAGLAVNRCGETVQLVGDVDVRLVRSSSPTTTALNGKTFGCCDPLKSGGRRTGDGVYLLTIAPASGREGRATVNGISTDSAKCNSKYLVEGTQFNLVPVGDPLLTANDFSPDNLPFLRNRIAYKCFGTADQAKLLQNPFGTPLLQYGIVDELLADGTLSQSEMPLSLVYWTSTKGIEFVDMWSVRRRLVQRPAGGGLFAFAAERRTAEAEAIFLQFQQQIADIVINESNILDIKATERFKLLPPVGIIPCGGMAAARGFDITGFFDGLTCRKPLFIEGAKVRCLLLDSLAFPPIEPSSKELVWQYLVRENFQAIDDAKINPPQPDLIFANGQIPFRADPRYDLSRWNYANFS